MKSKKLLVVMLIILSLFTFSTSCFAIAMDTDVTDNNEKNDFVINGNIVVPNFEDIVGSNEQYFIARKDLSDDGGYRLFVADGCDVYYGGNIGINFSGNRFDLLLKNDNEWLILGNKNTGSTYRLKMYDLVGGAWSFYASYSSNWDISSTYCSAYNFTGIDSIVYTSFPLPYPTENILLSYLSSDKSLNLSNISSNDLQNNLSGEVVFQVPPLSKNILSPIVEGVEMNKVLEEVVQMIPIVMIVVVGLIGFFKALRMLHQALAQS